MPVWHLKRFARLSVVLDDQFSISLLLKNFFLPWHRDFSVIGIFFGILMKLLYLPIGISIYTLGIFCYLLLFIIWLILPIGSLVFVLISLI
jgi:hypothetical protein